MALKMFGEKLGIAFQIKDDLFDIIGNQDGLGKPTGFDVKRNMLTLPFIHFFSNIDKSKKNYYRSKLRFYAKRKDLNEIKNIITDSGSMQYAQKIMEKISFSRGTKYMA